MTESKFVDTAVREIFPTYVWVHRLDRKDYEPINKALVEKLKEMRDSSGKGADESLHTERDLHKQDLGKPLVPFIEEATEHALSFLAVDHEGFEITGCWANVTPPGRAHRRHCHANSYLSGVYYVRVPVGADIISFEDPRPQTGAIVPKYKALIPQNSGIISPQVEEGMLLVFPSWLMHYVVPNRSDEDRISVGFNITFSSFNEVMAAPRRRADVYF